MWFSFPVNNDHYKQFTKTTNPEIEERLVLCMCLTQLCCVKHLIVGQSERVRESFTPTLTSV